MSLTTSQEKVQKLQRALYTKAKAEPGYRFYSLWDKIWREDVLQQSYRRCRENKGSAGVDGETFERIESEGPEAWLGRLEEELRTGQYRSQPLKRVWRAKLLHLTDDGRWVVFDYIAANVSIEHEEHHHSSLISNRR